MEGKERRVSDRSLENLKLGAAARYQGKVRQNVTILPDSLEWLKKGGNVSGRIDELVAAAKSGELKSIHTHDRKNEERLSSESVYKQIDELKTEIELLRSERVSLQQDCERLTTELAACQASQPQQPDLEAIRDHALTKLKVGKQAPEYKRAKKYMDLLLAELL